MLQDEMTPMCSLCIWSMWRHTEGQKLHTNKAHFPNYLENCTSAALQKLLAHAVSKQSLICSYAFLFCSLTQPCTCNKCFSEL